MAAQPNFVPDVGDDKYIVKGWAFCKDIANADETERYALSRRNPVYGEAFSYKLENDRKRCAMEAFLTCADQTIEQIANYFGTTPSVVETYAALFYDVRDKLKQPGYIFANILSGGQELPDNGNHPHYAWKLIALFGGVQMVRAMWECRPVDNYVKDFFENLGESRLAIGFGMGNYFRPINKFSASDMSYQYLKNKEIVTKAQMFGGADQSSRIMNDMLTNMLSNARFDYPESQTLNLIDADGRERRVHELLAIPAQVTIKDASEQNAAKSVDGEASGKEIVL